MYLKDYVKEFDYYSPVIIANNDYLKDNKEEARKLSAIKRLPIYGASIEVTDILIKNAPELQEKRLCHRISKYLSKEYASDKEKWGHRCRCSLECSSQMGAKRMVSLVKDLTDKGFTNEFGEIMTEIRLEHAVMPMVNEGARKTNQDSVLCLVVTVGKRTC